MQQCCTTKYIKTPQRKSLIPPSLSMLRPPYLHHSHVVSRLLVRVDDWTAHGSQGSESLHVLIGKNGFTLLPPLSQSNVQRLGRNDSPVHLSHCFCSLFRRREADETEAFALATVGHHLKFRDVGCKRH